VCRIAILGQSDRLPWRAAKVCFENQRDFHYLSLDDLQSKAVVNDQGIHLAGMDYAVLILDPEFRIGDSAITQKLQQSGRVFEFRPDDPAGLIAYLDRMIPPDFGLDPPCPGLRVRHVQKNGTDAYLLFNEGLEPATITIKFSSKGPCWIFDPVSGNSSVWDHPSTIPFNPGEWKALWFKTS
jgi:hypothetical protein